MYSIRNNYALLLIITLSLVVFVRSQADSSDEEDNPGAATYDYIVIGLGNGGSAAAARLSEIGTVFGIEGGGPSQQVLNGTDYVASHLTYDNQGNVIVNQPYTRWDVPIFAPTIYYPPSPYPDYPMYFNGFLFDSFVCKILGGAGVHNGMVFLRFSQPTIDAWNITGWSYNETLQWYKKIENVTGTSTQGDTVYHGLSGPIGLNDSPQNQYYSAVPVWIQACNETGIPHNPDYNGPTRYGCGTQVWNIRNDTGLRDSAAAAYLPPALKGGNLTISLYSEATKVLIKKKSGIVSAYGVEYTLNGTTKTVLARKEVILSASAIFTPKLLLLSGIGPKALLRSLGIKVWVDSPNVGVGLQSNHFGNGLWTFPNATYPNGLKIAEQATPYAFNGTGPWAWTAQFGDGYACSSNATNCTSPNVYVGTAVGDYTLLTTVGTATPKCRGNVTISTTDPTAPPNVTLNSYEFQEDLDNVVYAYQLLRRLFNTTAARSVFPVELIPGPAYNTTEQLQEYVLGNTAAVAHWVGSAQIGNVGSGTVCDPYQRVNGITGLRIADASIFPSTNTHTAASAIVAGERVADFIKRGL